MSYSDQLKAERDAAIADAARMRRELEALRDEMRSRVRVLLGGADKAREDRFWSQVDAALACKREVEPLADRIDAIIAGEAKQ